MNSHELVETVAPSLTVTVLDPSTVMGSAPTGRRLLALTNNKGIVRTITAYARHRTRTFPPNHLGVQLALEYVLQQEA